MSLDQSTISVAESTNYKNEYVFLHDNPLYTNIGDILGDGDDSSSSKEMKVHMAIYSLSPHAHFHLPAPTPGKLNTYTHETSTPLLKYLVKLNEDPRQYEFPSFQFLVSAEDQDEQVNLRFREECFLNMFEFLQLNVCEYSESDNKSDMLKEEDKPLKSDMNPVSEYPASDSPVSEPNMTPVSDSTASYPTVTPVSDPTVNPISESPASDTNMTNVSDTNMNHEKNPTKMGGFVDNQSCDTKTEIKHMFESSNEFTESVYRGFVASKDRSNIIVLLNYDELFLRVNMSKPTDTNVQDHSEGSSSDSKPPATFLKPIIHDMYPVSDDNLASRFARWALVYELIYKMKILDVPVDPMIDDIFWENKAAYQLHYLYYDKLNPKSLDDIISMGVSVSAEQIEQSKMGDGVILRRRDRIVDFPFCVYLVNDYFLNESAPKTREESDKILNSVHIPSRIDTYKHSEYYGDRYCFSLNPISDDPDIVSNLKRYAFLEYEEKYLDDGASIEDDEASVEDNGASIEDDGVFTEFIEDLAVGGSDEPKTSEPSETPATPEPSAPSETTEPSAPSETPEQIDDSENEFMNMSVATIHFRQKIDEKEVTIWGVLSKGTFVPL